MSKAFDRVDWKFLENMMLKLGSANSFVAKIMKCVVSVSYRVKINGQISERFRPEKGLRQGDPISPFLFLICQEWLSCNLRKGQEENKITGVKLARNVPRINHLLFADDCLIFIKAELRCLQELNRVLTEYESYAGQKINYRKSEICGSNNLDVGMVMLFGDYLGMEVVQNHAKYLDLPLVVGKNRTKILKASRKTFRKRFKAGSLSSSQPLARKP